MAVIKVKSMDYYLKHFKKNKIPFNYIQTLSTETIITNEDTLKFTSNEIRLNNYELSLIRMTKKHCEQLKDIPNTQPSQVKYIDVGKVINKNVTYNKDIWELDLSSAYWESAYNDNFITEDIYNYGKGKRISKMGRLIALGALAKSPTEQYFDGDIYHEIERKENKTSGIFFECANKISLEMNVLKILSQENFLFFWVDAIFFQGEETKIKLERYLNSKKLKYKIMKLDKMNINKKESNITVYCSEEDDRKRKGEPRKFNFKKNRKRKIKILMNNTLIKYTCKSELQGLYFSTYEKYIEGDIKEFISGVKVIDYTFEERKKYIYEITLVNKFTTSIMNLEFNVNTETELNTKIKGYLSSYNISNQKIKILQ